MSKIEWTEKTWNPISGCTKGYENGFAVTLHRDKLDEPLKRKKPTMYFVCSMGDLFHEDVPFEFIDDVFLIMGLCPEHTFQILTKRPERMREYMLRKRPAAAIVTSRYTKKVQEYVHSDKVSQNLPNVWLGVTAENQE